jgi:predicted 2-oxoglutarate/Fe(II)-dependent dioxygenase YbiX
VIHRRTPEAVLPPSVYLASNFLDAADCRYLRDAMDRGRAEAAEILDEGVGPDEEVRRAANVDVDAAIIAAVEARLDATRDAIAGFFGVPLGEREGASFLRYGAGGFYLPHVDRAESESWEGAARRQISVVVFINDDFTGGALHVIDARHVVQPAPGLLVAFDAGLLHEVEPVGEGIRYAIVDWFYDPGPAL